MTTEPPVRLLAIYEFASSEDHMMGSLLQNLAGELPGLRVQCVSGLFREYRPGGLRPKRLLNLAWVYAAVFLRLLGPRPTVALVHSAPPGVQLWTVFWAALRGVPVVFWLMDYHPELEARILERRGWRLGSRVLRQVDAWLMPRFEVIVTLDEAMATLARSRAGHVEVWEHPTWGTTKPLPVIEPVREPAGVGEPLRLVYSGNLGVAHDLAPLRQLIRALVRSRPLALLVIGASADGESRFRALAAETGIELQLRPRIPFAELPRAYAEYRVHAGIVLLAAESGGLVSPSKFSGYINFGVPLVYVGPAATNTALVCTRFGGGFWLPTSAVEDDVQAVAAKLLDAQTLAAAAAGARAAADHFARFDGQSLARLLAPRFRELAAASARR